MMNHSKEDEIDKLLAIGSETILKEVSVELNKMAMALSKFKGDKKPYQDRIDLFKNLLNFAIATQVKNSSIWLDYHNALMDVAKMKHQRDMLVGELSILEKVSELGADQAVEEFSLKLREKFT